jgi:hypothetical protein
LFIRVSPATLFTTSDHNHVTNMNDIRINMNKSKYE